MSAPGYTVHAAACVLAAATLSAPAPISRDASPPTRTVAGRFLGARYAPLAAADSATVAIEVSRALSRNSRIPAELTRATALLLGGQPEAAIVDAQSSATWSTDVPSVLLVSAAHLERARRDEHVADWATAANTAEHVTRLDPSRPEGWFNRALAFDRLGWSRWTRAWAAFRERDSRSPWASEGPPPDQQVVDLTWQRARLLDLDAAVTHEGLVGEAARHADRLRALIEDELLQHWAASTLGHDHRAAARALARAREVADAVFRATRDSTAIDWVEEVDAAPVGARLDIADAIRLAAVARRALEAGDSVTARHAVTSIGHRLATLPAHAGSTELLTSSVEYYEFRYSDGYARLANLIQTLRSPSRAYVVGRAHFAMAAISVRLGNYSTAELHYDRAREALASAGDVSLLASSHAIQGSLWHEQGDYEAAWAMLRESLQLLPDVLSDGNRYSILTWGLRFSLDARLPYLAMAFAEQLEVVATRWDNDIAATSVLTDEALLMSALGDRLGASEKLAQARERASRIADPNILPVSAAQLAKAEAGVLAAVDPCGAQAAYDRAIALSSSTVQFQLARLYLASAEAKRRCGAVDQAGHAYQQGIEALERLQSRIRRPDLRLSHIDGLWALYSGLAALTSEDLADPASGLMIAEAGRRQASLAATPRPMPPLRSLERIQLRLSEDACVVSYVVTADRVLMWAVTRQRVRFAVAAVPQLRLRGLVADWRASVEHGRDDRPAAARLFDLLLQPLEDEWSGRRLLAVVPDAELHDVAFGALWDGEAYLVERTTLWNAQSVTELAMSLAETPASPTRQTATLIVGDPAFDPRTHPGLSRLRGAAKEATSVAQFYSNPRVLIGAEATASAITAGFRASTVVHLAAHAVPDLANPARSFILAADGRLEIGSLLAHADVGRTVAVLSACRSASGPVARGLGAQGLAQALVARGAPAVLGMLWDIGDTDAQPLAVEFHRRLSAGEPAALALRQAQLALLRRGNDAARRPAAWAAAIGFGRPNVTAVAKGTA